MKYWLFIVSTILFSACTRPDRQTVDKLNLQSYAYHYRNIDSTLHLAQRAYQMAEDYDAGKAEALNNLAFVHIVKMEYDEAERLLQEVTEVTDNQLQCFIAYVQQMRYRELADLAMRRINEEREQLSPAETRLLLYAETEYAIVNSTYYYYVGLERQSIDALLSINPAEIQKDTAQFLNYLYNIGAGGILTEGTQQTINQQEFDHLMRCFLMARDGGYPYFAANALE